MKELIHRWKSKLHLSLQMHGWEERLVLLAMSPRIDSFTYQGKTSIRDREGTPKNFCDKDFAERSGELSGVICLKTLVVLGSALELFRKNYAH